MQKPNNYDNIKVSEYTPIKLGGHILEIVSIKETVSRSGKPMLVINFDFSQEDEQPGFFSIRFSFDQRPEPRWPSQATSYIVPVDQNDECSRNFKLFILAVEKSNPGFEVNWMEGPEFAQQFSGKRVGGVFGNVEEEFNGEVSMKRKLRWFCSVDAAKNAMIPKDKLLNKPAVPLVEITTDSEDSCPF